MEFSCAYRISNGTCVFDPESAGLTPSCSSDERLKENIRDTGSALEYFKGFHIRDYEVISSGDTLTGVVAQEVLETHPELVSEGPDGLLKVTQVSVWRLVKAIQELWQNVVSFADSFTTKKLCVGSACVTETEFLQMIRASGATPVTPDTPIAQETTNAVATINEAIATSTIATTGEMMWEQDMPENMLDDGDSETQLDNPSPQTPEQTDAPETQNDGGIKPKGAVIELVDTHIDN